MATDKSTWFDWTEERVERLKQLWKDGHSARACAGMLGCSSRSAVIGKVHRLGLSGRLMVARKCVDNAAKNRRARARLAGADIPDHRARNGFGGRGLSARQKAQRAAQAAEHVHIQSLPDIVVPSGERRTFADLEPGDCRWPFGDPQHADFHYCNRLAVGTDKRGCRGALPYCEFHAKRAYQPPLLGRNAPTLANTGMPWATSARGGSVIGDAAKSLPEFDEMTRG